MTKHSLPWFGIVGLSMTLMSCSDPIPPAAQGAVRYNLLKQADGPTCAASLQNEGMGSVDGKERSPLIHENAGATIKCRVAPDGAGFSFDGDVSLENNSFTIQGTATPGQDANAIVTVYSDKAKATYYTDTSKPCVVSITASEAEPQLGAAAGRIWGKLSCPSMVHQGAPTDEARCAIRSPASASAPGAYFVFENCSE